MKIQPFSKPNSRAAQIIEDAATRTKDKKKQKGLTDISTRLSDTAYKVTHFPGTYKPISIHAELKWINMKNATYFIHQMSIAMEDGTYLVPKLIFDWDSNVISMIEADPNNPYGIQYNIYKCATESIDEESVLWGVNLMSQTAKITNDQRVSFYNNFLYWKERITDLTNLGLMCDWQQLSRIVVYQTREYFLTNKLKFVVHDYLKSIVKGFKLINKIITKKGKHYVNYLFEDGTYGSTIVGEKFIKQYRKNTSIAMRENFVSFCVHETLYQERNIELENNPDQDSFNIPYYYFSIMNFAEETTFLMPANGGWATVPKPQHKDIPLNFPTPNKGIPLSFEINDDYKGRFDIDFYHAYFGRDFVKEAELMQDYYCGEWTDSDLNIAGFESILFSRAYKEQIIKENNPDFVPNGTGFKPLNAKHLV